MKNEIDISTGLRVPLQIPLDVKLFCKSEALLSDLGAENNLAYTYYDGLVVMCQEERSKWEWKEDDGSDQVKLLENNFVYPAGWNVNDINYSLKSYNFFEVFTDFSAIDQRLDTLENQTDVDNVFITIPAWSSSANWLKIHAGGKWKYNGVVNQNLIDFEFTVEYSNSGRQRLVYFVPNAYNGFTEISGPESIGIAKAPLLPIKDFFYTYFLVTDSSIGVPADPSFIKVPTIEEVLTSGAASKRYIWFWNTINSFCTRFASDHILFQKLESVFNFIKSDYTTQSYTVQLPNKTGGAEQTFAMVSDIPELSGLLPDDIINEGDITITGLNFSIIAEDFDWRLAQVQYTNTTIFSAVLTTVFKMTLS